MSDTETSQRPICVGSTSVSREDAAPQTRENDLEDARKVHPIGWARCATRLCEVRRIIVKQRREIGQHNCQPG